MVVKWFSLSVQMGKDFGCCVARFELKQNKTMVLNMNRANFAADGIALKVGKNFVYFNGSVYRRLPPPGERFS